MQPPTPPAAPATPAPATREAIRRQLGFGLIAPARPRQ